MHQDEQTISSNMIWHPTYLFSKDEDDATLKILVQFGNNSPSAKVFVIKHSDYDQMKHTAETERMYITEEKEQITYDNSEDKKKKKQFWTKMNDLADIKNARLWSINLNGKVCFALVVNTLSPLKKLSLVLLR